MGYVRVSPGVWRDTVTGKTVNSPTMPVANKGPVVPGKKTQNAINSTGITGASTNNSITGITPNTSNAQGVRQTTTANTSTMATGGTTAPDYNTALAHAEKQLARQTDPAKKTAWQKRVNDIRSGKYTTSGAAATTTNTTAGTTGTVTQDPTTEEGQGNILNNEIYGDIVSGAYDPIGNDTTEFDAQPYIDSAFAQLTRGVDDQYKREKEALAAELYNTGNDVGSPKYNNQMKILEDKYSGIKADARNQAVLTGEAAKTNYVQNKTAIRDADINLIKMKGELRKQWKEEGRSDKEIDLAFKKLNEDIAARKEAARIEREKIRKMGSGGGGGAAPVVDSAFSNSPYPGTPTGA